MSDMPPTQWVVGNRVLVPRTDDDWDDVSERYGRGSILNSRLTKMRSLPKHKLYWALLRRVVKATGKWVSAEHLHRAIKIELRMVEAITLLDGKTVRFEPSSTGFESMDEGEFNLFFKNAMLALEEGTGINMQELIEEARRELGLIEPLKEAA